MAFFNFLASSRKQNAGHDPEKDAVISAIKEKSFSTFGSYRQNIENIVASKSVVNQVADEINARTPSFSTIIDNMDGMTPVSSDKPTRIKQYRTIASFPECDWCIEEIADDFLHEDETGEFVSLRLNEKKDSLTPERKEVIQNEFAKFIELFNLRENAFNLVKKFLIEGELAWENILNPDHPDLGIIGVKFLPSEYYELLVNKNTGQKIGLYFDAKKYATDVRQYVSMSYYGANKIFNNMLGTTFSTFKKDDCITMLWPQVTYIHSSDMSPDGLICFPMIDKCKQAYYQLVLLQDSAVILRVTHAPERLLFNIDTGRMSDKVADGYIRSFANELKQKKIIEGGKNGPKIANVYNPTTMLESWIFGKNNQNNGTTVESVGSSVTYDQIDDIKYFLKRLLKQFKVPFSRFESPDRSYEKNDQISYEEYDFSRQEIRLQRTFAEGFKKSFITHLKLRKIWPRYDLKETDFTIQFVKPVLYDLYQSQKLLETKISMYATLTDREEFSKILAMKNILKMTEEQIEENYDNLVKERSLLGSVNWYEEQMRMNGPKVVKPPVPIKNISGDDHETDLSDAIHSLPEPMKIGAEAEEEAKDEKEIRIETPDEFPEDWPEEENGESGSSLENDLEDQVYPEDGVRTGLI